MTRKRLSIAVLALMVISGCADDGANDTTTTTLLLASDGSATSGSPTDEATAPSTPSPDPAQPDQEPSDLPSFDIDITLLANWEVVGEQIDELCNAGWPDRDPLAPFGTSTAAVTDNSFIDCRFEGMDIPSGTIREAGGETTEFSPNMWIEVKAMTEAEGQVLQQQYEAAPPDLRVDPVADFEFETLIDEAGLADFTETEEVYLLSVCEVLREDNYGYFRPLSDPPIGGFTPAGDEVLYRNGNYSFRAPGGVWILLNYSAELSLLDDHQSSVVAASDLIVTSVMAGIVPELSSIELPDMAICSDVYDDKEP